MLWSVLLIVQGLAACDGDDGGTATVRIKNDFNNPGMAFQPPWTICEAVYMGVEFGRIPIGETSAALEVPAGLDNVLMVAAWNDPDCDPGNCLPLASRNEEEVVDGQERTIALNLPNHQGACPPEGVAPIPEVLYERIRELYPAYGFKPYAERLQNPQCVN